jgi:hypothetical protein
LQVESVDPIQREVVQLTLSPAGVESADPPESVATLVVATLEAIDADVGNAFCRRVRHFVSRESALAFAANLSSCHVVELSELQEAADLLHEAIWSAALD